MVFIEKRIRPKEEDIFGKSTNKTWIPLKNHHIIEATNNEINEEIVHIKPPIYSNLSKGEQEALEDLQEKDDMVFANADKGGAVVIMGVTDYLEKSERQLNKEHYHQLSNDQTAAKNETVNNSKERFQKEYLITKNVAKGHKTASPRTPRFYIQPKINRHGNAGRPAISSVNCHRSNISKYVDYHLQPIF